MDERNELNDIILNKSNPSAGNKKIILAVAALGVVLIVVVMLMNTLTSNGTDNLPQAAITPEVQEQAAAQVDESFFEKVDAVKESAEKNASLDEIAQKLKEENIEEETQTAAQEIIEPVLAETQKTETKKVETKKTVVQNGAKEPKTNTLDSSNGYYVQVGSFTKYKPNKKFLDSILKLGYKYKFHKTTVNSKTFNKVLIGPFKNEAEARRALVPIKKSVEAGAFLIKI